MKTKNSKQDDSRLKMSKFTMKCKAIRTLSEHSVRMAIHFFVNFGIYKKLYLAQYQYLGLDFCSCWTFIVVPLEGIFTSDSGFKSFPGFYFNLFEKEMHFEGGYRGFSCSFEAPIASAFALPCHAVVSADSVLRYISSRLFYILLQFCCFNFSSGMAK